MCLKTIINRETKKTGFGWKVFQVSSGKLFTEMKGNEKALSVQTWLNEKKFRKIKTEDNTTPDDHSKSYPVGFHIFKTEKAAKNWMSVGCGLETHVVKKVAYRKAHTHGVQEGFGDDYRVLKVVVAKEIKIL